MLSASGRSKSVRIYIKTSILQTLLIPHITEQSNNIIKQHMSAIAFGRMGMHQWTLTNG